MTAFDRTVDLLTEWLDDQPERAPAHLVDTICTDLRTAPQHARWKVALRRIPLFSSNTVRFSLVAAVLVIAVVGGYSLWAGGPSTGPAGQASPPPSPTLAATVTPTAVPSSPPSPAASAAANPLLDLSRWSPYTSSQYDLDMLVPEHWTLDPATRAWDLDTDAPDWLSPAMDNFLSPDRDVLLSVWSAPLEPGIIVDETREEVEAWILEYCEKAGGGDRCAEALDHTIPLCVEFRDCHPGVLVAAPGGDTQAFFTSGIYGDQMVVVSIWRDTADPSLARYGGGVSLMDAFLQPLCVFREDERHEPPPQCPNSGTE